MADFRKLLLALIAGALLFTTVASAQPYSCNATAVPTLARSEGIAEMMGDILLNCTGSVPAGGILANIRLRLTANVTSNPVTSDKTPNQLEAMLILDGGADGYRAYGSTAGTQNIYQAAKVPLSNDEITWNGVWLAAPGSAAFRSIRLTNVRGDVHARGDFATIYASINIDAPTSVPVDNNLLVVADTRPGMSFSVDDISLKNCEDPTSASVFTLNFQEGYASAFRPKLTGTALFTAAEIHNVPGGGYLDESGFHPVQFTGSLTGSALIGLANQGTRLMARFKDIPDGVDLIAPGAVTVPVTGLVLTAVEDPESDGSGGTLSTSATYTIGSDGLLVYEVTGISDLSFGAIEKVEIDVRVDFDVPGPLGTGVVNGNFAPTSTVFTMNYKAPEPRFVDKNAADEDAFAIGACRTILLFPYVTNQAQFDTGIAIANTSRDPVGTTNQAGACKLYYYGNTNGSTGPASQSTPSVPAGGHFVMSIALGGGVFAYNGAFTACASGNCVAPLFEGYIFAICDFQFAHGFAYVNDNGPSKLGAMGYLALIVPDRGDENRAPQNDSKDPLANEGEGLSN